MIKKRPAPPAPRPPHPAKVAQPSSRALPPHPAKVAQPFSRLLPPHPARVAQPFSRARGPHPAARGGSVVQRAQQVGTSVLEDTLWIRESDTDHEMTLTLKEGALMKYGKDDDCGNVLHKTHTGKKFEHLHVNYVLPIEGKDEGNVTRWITLAKINAYWDNRYAGYERIAGADIRYNCIAYARGYTDAWIEPNIADARGVIATEDYELTADYTKASVEQGNFHDILIVEAAEGKILKTREKNAQSGIYAKNEVEGRKCGGAYKLMKRK
ncbi:DUF7689 domain-containing protein [Sorangium sp. So ce887]|uniref:DUF7689 domain-containing protein n=1 Tax=Sorangium sp. So ce887 TaxID=3133324 RepID=UPI003F615F9A